MRTVLFIAPGGMLAAPATAAAQTGARLSAGVGVTFYESTGRGIDDSERLTPALRGRRSGWRPAGGAPGHRDLARQAATRIAPLSDDRSLNHTAAPQ